MAIPIYDEYEDGNGDHNNNIVIPQGVQGANAQVNNQRNLIAEHQVPNYIGLEENIGFIHRLINELYSVFVNCQQRQVDMVPLQLNEVIGGQEVRGLDRRASSRRNGDSGNRRRHDAGVRNMQDNQNPTGLPDIISCHVGASLRINHSSSSIPPSRDHYLQNDQDDDQDELRPQPPPYVASRNGEESDSPSEDDEYASFGLDFKVQLNCSYRGIGRDLRQIADNYELQNDRQRRRRHPAERQTHPMSSSFKFEFALKVAIPAVTLVGLGLAYLRRST